MITCPNCGNEEFEKRGERRCYAQLDEELEVDGWDEGDEITWDTDENDEEIIYCLRCDSEFTAQTLRPKEEET